MRRKSWLYAGLVAAAISLAAWVRINHAAPVPRGLVGVWENETRILSAKPGDVRLTISGDGSVEINFDRQRFKWWGPDQLHASVRGDTAEVWMDPENRAKYRITLESGRFTLTAPESSAPDFAFRVAEEE